MPQSALAGRQSHLSAALCSPTRAPQLEQALATARSATEQLAKERERSQADVAEANRRAEAEVERWQERAKQAEARTASLKGLKDAVRQKLAAEQQVAELQGAARLAARVVSPQARVDRCLMRCDRVCSRA